MDKYTIVKRLGKGAFSTVYLVKNELDEKHYAIKQIKVRPENKEEIQNEIKIIKKISKSEIDHLEYIEAFYDKDSNNFNIVTEFIENSQTLKQVIREHEKYIINFSCQNVEFVIKNLIEQLYWLHSHNIVHGDIKSDNILVQINKENEITRCVFIDFGLSCSNNCIPGGTLLYMAPEILGYTIKNREMLKKIKTEHSLIPLSLTEFKKTDVFSLGVVFYELINLRLPHEQTESHLISERIFNRRKSFSEDSESNEIYSENIFNHDKNVKNQLLRIKELDNFYKTTDVIESISPFDDIKEEYYCIPVRDIVNCMVKINPKERCSIKYIKNTYFN